MVGLGTWYNAYVPTCLPSDLARGFHMPRIVFEEGLTESELVVMNGLHRVYDSGRVLWVKDVL